MFRQTSFHLIVVSDLKIESDVWKTFLVLCSMSTCNSKEDSITQHCTYMYSCSNAECTCTCIYYSFTGRWMFLYTNYLYMYILFIHRLVNILLYQLFVHVYIHSQTGEYSCIPIICTCMCIINTFLYS